MSNLAARHDSCKVPLPGVGQDDFRILERLILSRSGEFKHGLVMFPFTFEDFRSFAHEHHLHTLKGVLHRHVDIALTPP
jgi:hypothetical protein